MGIRERVAARVATFKGQKSGVSLESTTIEDGSSIVNMMLKEGQMEKINGGTIYAEILPSESGGITSLTRFKNLTIAQRNFSIAAEDSEGSATFTTLTSALTSNNRMQYANWRDRAFMVNGVDAKFLLNRTSETLDANRTFGNLGMDPPTYSALALAAFQTNTTRGVGSVANGLYGYFITFFDKDTNSESPAIGAKINQDGLFEISINGDQYYAPVPQQNLVSGGPKSVIFAYADLVAYFNEQISLNPRITSFAIYRSTATSASISTRGDGYSYSSALRINNSVDGDATGICIFDINEFIAAGLDFVDGDAVAATTIGLPENNYPPPTVPRLKAIHDYLVTLGFVQGSFDYSANSGFSKIKVFRDQLFGVGASSVGNLINPISIAGVPIPLPPGLHKNDRYGNFQDILFGSEVYQPDYFPYIWEVGRRFLLRWLSLSASSLLLRSRLTRRIKLYAICDYESRSCVDFYLSSILRRLVLAFSSVGRRIVRMPALMLALA
jgi:hypothetical protein